MLQNKGGSPNTPPFPEVQPPAIVVAMDDDLDTPADYALAMGPASAR